MRHFKLFSSTLWLTMAMLMVAWSPAARADRTVNQLQFGKQTIEVGADETITFYDMNGTDNISSSSSNNSHSLTVFKPAEGMAIQLTFEKVDAHNDGANYPNYVNVYAGDPDADNSFAWATTTSGVTTSTTMPEGNLLEHLDGTFTNKTYIGNDGTGIISVGYLYKYAATIDGWVATVKCITLDDMTVTGASTNYDNVVAAPDAASGVNFVTGAVTATGIMNPDVVKQITFKVTANEDAIDPLKLRLYKGAQTSFAGASSVHEGLVADGDQYTFTLNEALSDGNNLFSIAGDFLGTAMPGVKAQVEITKIVTAAFPDGVTPFTTGTPVAVTKPAIVKISATPQTVTVGDIPYNFYDDGGKDGNITQGFEGQITFVPATEGNAIKIDFTKLDLFNTSTVGYNDVLKFYSGREVNEENLITTLLDEAEIVKSTAADGSLTVYLKCVAGTTKSGWEALVSQFLPGDMTVNTVSADADSQSTAKVSAGEQDARMLVVDVITDNQASPLSLSEIKLQSTTAERLAGYKVYYLGKKNVFSTSNVFAAGEASADMTATGSQELVEGHNYFAVVANVAGTVNTGDLVSIGVSGVKVGEVEYSISDGDVIVNRTVENVCRATEGSHSHDIYGDWTFTNTAGYSGKYETKNSDYIVTFYPKVENSIVEIDFSAFEIYYPSTNYGYETKPEFVIYSGSEVNTSNILWQLQNKEQATTGPGRKLRSTAADGSMTIRFNPKTTSTYYAATGWTATVRPFQNHDMDIKSVTVNQTSGDVVAVGSADAALIDFVAETEGTLTTKVIKKVNLDLKDSQESLSKVSVYYSNVNERSTAVLFGAVENPAESAVTVEGERELVDGKNYFWVSADVKADAAAEAVVDAKLLSLVDANNVATEVADGDPEGNRVVKYLYIIQAGNQTVTVTEPLLFYDDGGKDGKLTKGFKGTVVFLPGRENSAVQINTLSTFSIGSGKMYVYSGREANDANKLGSVTGYSTTGGPVNLVSKAEDGSMTVVFEANTTATTLDGWEIEVSLHEKTPFVIDDIEVANTTDQIVRGSKDNIMQRLMLAVSGDKNPIEVQSVKVDATGTTSVADIASAKVYFTGHNDLFVTDNLVASTTIAAGENVINLTEPITITENGDYYLWIAYDLAADATLGDNVVAKALSVTTSTGDIAIDADAATRLIKSGLKGNYIIGSGDNANYAKFADALEALAGGVEGDVTFQVEDGTYKENIQFASIPGAGADAKITFTSLSGDRDKVIVAGSGRSDNMPGSTAYKKGMVFIENTPYVTLEKMSFIPESESTYNYAVQIYDRSRHFTLRDCHVKATNVTSGYGMYLVQMSPVNGEGRNNDYATIENNLIEGGYIGLNVGGTAYLANTMEQGLVVRGNTINEGTKAMMVNPGINTVIENNTIYQSKIQKTGYWGIDANRLRGAFVIAGNKIVSETEYYSGGIYLRGDTYGYEGVPGRVYNNVISITKSSSTSSAGIQLDPSTHDVEIVNNSVRIGNSKGYTLYMSNSSSGAAANIKLQNNLFQNETESPVMFIGDRWFGNFTFGNNSFYSTSGNIKDEVNLDAFNKLENVENTIAVKAQFVSETNLHLTSAEGLQPATPIEWLTTDADGVQRNATAPTLGAYEYVEIVDNKPEIAEGNYPAVSAVTENSASIVTKWTEGGKLYAKVEKAEASAADGARRLKTVSSEDLLATEPTTILADTEVTTEFAELESSTDYVAYLMAVSDLGTASDVVTVDFATARHIEPLKATVPAVSATIDEGESATITATVTGGDAPYTIEWRDQMNNVVGNEATITVTPDYTYGYRATITGADGQTAAVKTAVIVRGDAVEATFEDNYLAEESFFNGDNDDDTWYSGSYAFSVGNAVWPGSTITFWYNYALSNQTSDVYSKLDDQYHSVTGGAYDGDNFVIAYPQGGEITVTNDAAGDEISGFYINNTAYAYYYLLNDNGEVSHAMRQGDWFKVTAKDVDDDDNAIDFYLSDFRSENEADRYNINTWEWFDLTPLGNVKGVTFTMSGSDTGKWGLNTPTYFAMDNFGGQPEMTNETRAVKARNNQKVNLATMFSYLDGPTVTYALDGELTGDDMDITLDAENNRLIVNGKQDNSERTIVVAMTQKGHTQRVRLTIVVDNVTAINSVEAESDVVEVTYVNAAGQVSTTPWQGVNIVVTRRADGSTSTEKRVMK